MGKVSGIDSEESSGIHPRVNWLDAFEQFYELTPESMEKIDAQIASPGLLRKPSGVALLVKFYTRQMLLENPELQNLLSSKRLIGADSINGVHFHEDLAKLFGEGSNLKLRVIDVSESPGSDVESYASDDDAQSIHVTVHSINHDSYFITNLAIGVLATDKAQKEEQEISKKLSEFDKKQAEPSESLKPKSRSSQTARPQLVNRKKAEITKEQIEKNILRHLAKNEQRFIEKQREKRQEQIKARRETKKIETREDDIQDSTTKQTTIEQEKNKIDTVKASIKPQENPNQRPLGSS